MKKYTQIYLMFKEMITSGQFARGGRMPSVRKASELYNISRTTVQNAYFQLSAEGYIFAKPKSGYFVSDMQVKTSVSKELSGTHSPVLYDFSGDMADARSFDFSLWQRYIKSALRQTERLLSYSEPQGEYDLRRALSEYIREKRNVITDADHIVIGAGVQSLLQILCSLIHDRQSVSFPDNSFIQGMSVFSDYGFDVKTRDKNSQIIYVSPSHMTQRGNVMPVKRRIELCNHSLKTGAIVIEDDYGSDFLYGTTPAPSLYALGKGNVIYMGSFSAMLLPGIRVSFMVLNAQLAERYNKNRHKFAQTASKTEQIALGSYLRDGNMNARMRKMRRLYITKTKLLFDVLKAALPNSNISIGENGLQVILKIQFDGDDDTFKRNGINVHIEKPENKKMTLVLSPSAISTDDLQNAAAALKTILLKG